MELFIISTKSNWPVSQTSTGLGTYSQEVQTSQKYFSMFYFN